MYCVYKHTFPNDKVYIGITSMNPLKRWASGKGYRNQPRVYNAILKYGWPNIKHEILLDGLSKGEAEQKEIELIAYYKSNQRDFGYNIDNGGNTPGMMSEESKLKISASLKGRHCSKEHREHISLANKGRKLSAKHREKLAQKKYRKVYQYTLDGKLVRIWDSVKEAKETLHISGISQCANGRHKFAGGYVWRYNGVC